MLRPTSSTNYHAVRCSAANALFVCAQKKVAGAKDAFKLTLKALATFEVRAQCNQETPVSPSVVPSRASPSDESVLMTWRNAGQGEEPAAVAAVKGVAADAVADYLRSADVYQV